MTTSQKIIKSFAIALAVLLVIGIASAVFKLGALLIGITSVAGNDSEKPEMTDLGVAESKKLSLELGAINLIIKKGDSFKAASDSANIKVTNKNGTLTIKEKNSLGIGFVSVNDTSETLVIEVPDGFVFDELDLEAGAGLIDIETLNAKDIDFELGAGEVKVSQLYVSGKADIEGGAGKLSIEGTINTLDLDMGIGKLDLKAVLTSKSTLSCGVGNADITLLGGKSNYDLDINKGIGTVSVDGKNANDYDSAPSGDAVKVIIDCGVGNIDIDFE